MSNRRRLRLSAHQNLDVPASPAITRRSLLRAGAGAAVVVAAFDRFPAAAAIPRQRGSADFVGGPAQFFLFGVPRSSPTSGQTISNVPLGSPSSLGGPVTLSTFADALAATP